MLIKNVIRIFIYHTPFKLRRGILAYNNQHIKKSHDLAELYAVIDSILLDEIELAASDQISFTPEKHHSVPQTQISLTTPHRAGIFVQAHRW